MDINANRLFSDKDSTLGHWQGAGVDCFTLEDQLQPIKKVKGETRIPGGSYQIKKREELSGLTQKYRARFPDWFDWHLTLQDVPNFKYVYVHILNTHEQTDGCLGVGYSASIYPKAPETIARSTEAFKEIYLAITAALDKGEEVWIHISGDKPAGSRKRGQK